MAGLFWSQNDPGMSSINSIIFSANQSYDMGMALRQSIIPREGSGSLGDHVSLKRLSIADRGYPKIVGTPQS